MIEYVSKQIETLIALLMLTIKLVLIGTVSELMTRQLLCDFFLFAQQPAK
jgi:hypothetical protein